MPYLQKDITKDIFDNAQKNNGYLTRADELKVFTTAELCGYGIYGARAWEKDGKYIVSYYRGSSCD